MNAENRLVDLLDRELDGLPAVPATDYLARGRRVRRRRRATVALSVVPVAALVFAVTQALPDTTATDDGAPAGPAASAPTVVAADPSLLRELEKDPDFVPPEPSNMLEAQDGLDGIDWFTSDEVPKWATEYGNYGPVALTADGRLYVAPEATVRRVVVDPYGSIDGVTKSYAVEAQCSCVEGPDFPGGISWVIISTDGTGPGGGTMDQPGLWTTDFELWVDDVTAHKQGRPSFAERLVRLEGNQLVANTPAAVILWQTPETGYSDNFAERGAAAEVKYLDTTWFVMGVDPRSGAEWYDASSGDLDTSVQAWIERWNTPIESGDLK